MTIGQVAAERGDIPNLFAAKPACHLEQQAAREAACQRRVIDTLQRRTCADANVVGVNGNIV